MLLITFMSASAIWHAGTSAFSGEPLLSSELVTALKNAAFKSNFDDAAFCKLHIDGEVLELAANGFALDFGEMDERQLMMRTGGALFRLKLALLQLECLGRVDLFPDLGQEKLIARIHCGKGRKPEARERVLFETLVTNRPPPRIADGSSTDSSQLIANLREAAATERAILEFSQADSSLQIVAPLAREESVSSPSDESGLTANRLALLRSGGSSAPRVSSWLKPFLGLSERISGGLNTSRKASRSSEVRTESSSLLAVVKTKTDDRRGWLQAGAALDRIRLQALASSVSCTVYSQAFQSVHVREDLRTRLGRKGFAQAVVRVAHLSGSLPILPVAERLAALKNP